MRGVARFVATLAPLASGFAFGAVEHMGTLEMEVEARVLGASAETPRQIRSRQGL